MKLFVHMHNILFHHYFYSNWRTWLFCRGEMAEIGKGENKTGDKFTIGDKLPGGVNWAPPVTRELIILRITTPNSTLHIFCANIFMMWDDLDTIVLDHDSVLVAIVHSSFLDTLVGRVSNQRIFGACVLVKTTHCLSHVGLFEDVPKLGATRFAGSHVFVTAAPS